MRRRPASRVRIARPGTTTRRLRARPSTPARATDSEVCLHITARAPKARWICGRSIVREQGLRGYRPNAVVEIGREHHAILVKLRAQSEERDRAILETHMARYDAVIAFCERAPRRRLERLAAEHHWPKLVVRDIPRPPT
jgi:hypothetical protein